MNEGMVNRILKVCFLVNMDMFSEEEEVDICYKWLFWYWYKGGWRYSEVEKVFLNWVRIFFVGLFGDGEIKVGWLRFFDFGGKNIELW